MKFFVPLLLTLSLFVSSCSSTYTNWDRSIANEVEPPVGLEELFTVKSTTNIDKSVNAISSFNQYMAHSMGMEIVFVDDPKMSTDVAFKIEPTIEDSKYKIKVHASAIAKHDQTAIREVEKLLSQFQEKFTSSYSLFELYYNIKLNDFPSMQTMAKVRAATTNAMNIQAGGTVNMDAEAVKYWAQVNEEFKTQERKFNKVKKTKTEARKAVMDALDKVSEDKQFRNLVANNDRKGAAQLLKAYLPWEEMPPFEKLFWETHLAVMVDPLPLEDRVFIYRGINDDIIQTAQVGGKALSKEDAVKEQKIFLMSTMMTKNQGTWNRRLRSLTAMYEKFMGTDHNGSSEFTGSTRITNMFKKHSMDPKGSPFLSYTPKFHVAQTFGSQKNTAYFLDPRLLYFNMTSGYTSEIEFLLPVASFPDDLASVYDFSIHGQQNVEEFLKKNAIAKLDQKLGAGKGAVAFDRIQLNSKKYFAPVINGTGKVTNAAPAAVDGKFVGFFKKLLGMPTPKVAEMIDDKSDMACTDLIQLFWK